LARNSKLANELRETSKEEHPIATLAVPAWKEMEKADTSEYDTYIILQFSSER
jgi:hypothetical protein